MNIVFKSETSRFFRLANFFIAENEDYGSYDPNCESKGDYTDWTPCHPKCKENENDVGKRRKKLVWKDNRSQKECGVRFINRFNFFFTFD